MRPGYDPWVGKIPWRRGRLPTLVFWPRKIPETKNQKIWHPWSLPLGIRWLKQKWLTSLLGMSFPCSFIHSFSTFWAYILVTFGFPGGSDGKESASNEGDIFDPRVGKIPWKKAWQPTPVFLPGESPWTEEPGGLQSMGLQRVRGDWATFTFRVPTSSSLVYFLF